MKVLNIKFLPKNEYFLTNPGFNVRFTSIPYNNHKIFCYGYLWFSGVIKLFDFTTTTTTNCGLSKKTIVISSKETGLAMKSQANLIIKWAAKFELPVRDAYGPMTFSANCFWVDCWSHVLVGLHSGNAAGRQYPESRAVSKGHNLCQPHRRYDILRENFALGVCDAARSRISTK